MQKSKPRSELNSGEDETLRQTQSESKHPNFEEYDAVRWQTAAEETTVDETRNEAEASASDNTKDVGERVIESPKPALTLEPEFVRARKDSKVGRKPYYKKGDVLRVINKTSRRDPNGE